MVLCEKAMIFAGERKVADIIKRLLNILIMYQIEL